MPRPPYPEGTIMRLGLERCLRSPTSERVAPQQLTRDCPKNDHERDSVLCELALPAQPATMAAALHRPEILPWHPIHIAQLDLPFNPLYGEFLELAPHNGIAYLFGGLLAVDTRHVGVTIPH